MRSDEGHVDLVFPSAADFQFADDADLDLFSLGISQISVDFADDLQISC